jgi:Zn-dependent protease with chaperone function
MKPLIKPLIVSAGFFVPGVMAIPAAAQSEAARGGMDVILAAAILVAVIGVTLAVTVKLLDLRRKRESQAVQLQAQISDALLQDAALVGLAVTPTVEVPLWRGSPVRVDVAGQVPTPEARLAVLRTARAEAARLRPNVDVRDRLVIGPGAARAA